MNIMMQIFQYFPILLTFFTIGSFPSMTAVTLVSIRCVFTYSIVGTRVAYARINYLKRKYWKDRTNKAMLQIRFLTYCALLGRMLASSTQLRRYKRFEDLIMLVWTQGSIFHTAAGSHPVQEAWGSQDNLYRGQM